MKCILSLIIMLSVVSPSKSQEVATKHASVDLPPELDRILRDYEDAWSGGEPETLAALFTEDGFALPSGRPPFRGRDAISRAYARANGPLSLRALAFEIDGSVGYIVGAFTYNPDDEDSGKFVLAIRKTSGGAWLIAADIDNSIRGQD